MLKMGEIKEDINKIWEVSIMQLEEDGKRFKVTRRIPKLSVSETKFFKTKEKAKKQFEEWLK